MKNYSLSHLSNDALLRALNDLVAQDRSTTADLLAHIAEVDSRKLYLPAGYPSMYAYCQGELKLSEEMASKRIRVARLARHFPLIFSMVADGRLSLSAVVVLSTALTAENAEDLLIAASHMTRAQLEVLLANRSPRLELSSGLTALQGAGPRETHNGSPSPGRVTLRKPGPSEVPPQPIQAVSPERFTLQVTIDKTTHDLLLYAQDLMSHSMNPHDLSGVLQRVLRLGVQQLEKRKFAATDRPRVSRGPLASPRQIPAAVRRAVWQRDGGRCTFHSSTGRRCPSTRKLEFDHIEPVARGGPATIENLRLRCRAHNQYEAERAYGTDFMHQKREEAVEARKTRERIHEVAQCLRQLRYRADEARRAADFSDSIPCASLEERVKRALTYFAPRVTCHAAG